MKTIAAREDITVERENGVVVKTAHTEAGEAELANETRFLVDLSSTPCVPTLREASKARLVTEDVGDDQPVQDEAAFLRACITLLCEFRVRGIRHGDLTAKNLIVRGDCPVAVDFGQSTFADEDGLSKRAKPDAYYFWRAVNEKHPGIRAVDRWIAVRGALGGDEDDAWGSLGGRDVLDLGCYTGETTAMAATEGAAAVGVDRDAEAVMRAREVWHPYGCQFLCADIVGYEPEAADIVFLFSTWAYMVRDHGRKAAEEALALLVKRSQVLFFETQLRGDGPGPDFLESNTDVAVMLNRFGKIEALTTTPVAGRDAWRTVWSVKPR